MSSSERALLAARGLRCVRDRRVLFDQLDFTLEPGSVLHLEGANGAGKTSLLRVLCGLLPATAGEVLWRGHSIRQRRVEYHAELLYLGHSPGIKLDLTALENLRFLATLGGRGFDADPDSAERALAEIGLAGFEDLPVRRLSAGQRRRVALARLWFGRRPLWLLDEPLTALDSAAGERLQTRIRCHAETGGAVLLTSHQPLAVATASLRLA